VVEAYPADDAMTVMEVEPVVGLLFIIMELGVRMSKEYSRDKEENLFANVATRDPLADRTPKEGFETEPVAEIHLVACDADPTHLYSTEKPNIA